MEERLMKKKQYLKPETEVMKLDVKLSLLVPSNVNQQLQNETIDDPILII